MASLYEVTHRYPEHWHGAWSIDRCIAEWNSDVRRSWQYRDRENHLFVHYERLLDDPVTVLKELCGFFKIEFHADMLAEQPQAAQTLVLPGEPWKGQALRRLDQTPTRKFATIFDPQQQGYIRSRLLSLPPDLKAPLPSASRVPNIVPTNGCHPPELESLAAGASSRGGNESCF